VPAGFGALLLPPPQPIEITDRDRTRAKATIFFMVYSRMTSIF
jgi:hypothetical protein